MRIAKSARNLQPSTVAVWVFSKHDYMRIEIRQSCGHYAFCYECNHLCPTNRLQRNTVRVIQVVMVIMCEWSWHPKTVDTSQSQCMLGSRTSNKIDETPRPETRSASGPAWFKRALPCPYRLIPGPQKRGPSTEYDSFLLWRSSPST